MPRPRARNRGTVVPDGRMTTVSVRLNATTAEALATLCRRHGCSVSEAIRRAIRDQASDNRQMLQDILAAVSALARATGAGPTAPPAPEGSPVRAILAWSRQLDEEGPE